MLNPDYGKHLEINRLQIPPLKIRPFRQKNRGPTENISHFFSRFYGFFGLFPLQVFDLQPPTTVETLQKKSCPKTDGRFSLPSKMCHNRPVTVEMTGRNEGCERWTAANRPPAWRARRFGARNGSSAFGRLAGKRRCRARSKTCRPFRRQSKPIKANQSQSHLIKVRKAVTNHEPLNLT
jgi:hypothetical protein